MNWDRIEGNWRQLKGKVKEQWGKITDDDLDVILGKRDQLLGRMQESYGAGKDETERLLRDWESRNHRHFGGIAKSQRITPSGGIMKLTSYAVAISSSISADYKAARERCNSLAGNARDMCVNDAKSRFGMM